MAALPTGNLTDQLTDHLRTVLDDLHAFSASTLSLTSPFASASASPFASPLPTPTPVPARATRLALTLDAAPVWLEPGEMTTFTVTLANPSAAPVVGLVLTDTLPAGLAYVAQSAVGFAYSARDRRLTWQAPRLAAGTTITGSFQARAQDLAVGATVTNTVTATASGLAEPVSANVVVDVVSSRADETWITAGQGGLLRSMDDRVLLRVPPGAVSKRTRFSYRPRTDAPNPPPGLRFAFSLEAQDEQGQAVRQFPAPLELTVAYSGVDAGAWPALFYYDEAAMHWQPVPMAERPGRWQARARLEHLTLFATTTTAEPVPFPAVGDWMSQVRGTRTALFSRSVAYDYDLDLIPGTGGLTPSLGLRYNSASHTQHQGHYSYVGHGWELAGANTIYRDPTKVGTADEKITLSLQERLYTIQRYTGTDNKVHFFAKEDPFLRIDYTEHYSPYWGGAPNYADESGAKYSYRNWFQFIVTTRENTRFTFKGQLGINGDLAGPNVVQVVSYPMEYVWGCSVVDQNWRHLYWTRLPLISVHDANGNTVEYDWAPQDLAEFSTYQPATCLPSFLAARGGWYIEAIRLTQIRYNANRAIVKLNYASRIDRPNLCDDTAILADNNFCFRLKQRLSIIEVRAQPNGGSEQIIRTYALENGQQSGGSQSQIALRLDKIIESSDGLQRATEFSYSGGDLVTECSANYLQRVRNPYGGQVEFNAETSTGQCSDTWTPPKVLTRTETDAIIGTSYTYTYTSAGWSNEVKGYGQVCVRQPDGGAETHAFHTIFNVANIDNVNEAAGLQTRVSQCDACGNDGDATCIGERARSETDWGWNLERLDQFAYPTPNLAVPFYDANNPGLSVKQQPRAFRAMETRSYLVDASGVLLPMKKVVNSYDRGLQIGPDQTASMAKLYGLNTRSEEYEGAGSNWSATPLRTTVTTYRPNGDLTNLTEPWLISQSAVQQVFAGAVSVTGAAVSGTLFGEKRFYYDNTTDYMLRPTAGLLRRVETLSVLNSAHQGNPASVSQYYDYENGNLKWARDARDNTTTFFYDPWYKAFRVCEQNAANQRTKTTYYGVPGDGTCNTTNGSALGTAGASFGQVEQVEDANGIRNRSAYDGLGRPQTVTLAVGTADQALQSYSYLPFDDPAIANPPDDPGRLETGQVFWVHTQQQDNAGGDGYLHTWTFYDGFGRPIETQQEADNNQHIETYRSYTFRDAPERASPPLLQPGNVTASASYTPVPTGAWTGQSHTRYEYDALGRPTTVTYPDSTSQTTTYVAEGRSSGVRSIITATDERGRQRKTEQDAFGRLRNSTIYTLSGVAGYPDNTPISAGYDYNVADQLTAVTAPGGFVTAVGYDGLGRKASVNDPDLGLWRYTYDNAGNLATQTDARGVTLWFAYDSLNRLTTKRQTDAAGPLLAQYFYDEAQAGYANLGRRTRATAYEYRDSWGGPTTLANALAQSYDARGRVKVATRTVDGVAYTTQYAYDLLDRLTGLTYPDGEQATTAYGSQGQPGSLTATPGGTLADSASYDEANRLRSLRLPAGGNLVRREVYYPWTQQRGRLQSLLVGTSATGADRLNLTYTYDAVGNVSSISDNGVLSSFAYDGLYQVRAAYSQTFAYDTASRLTDLNGLAYTPDGAHPHAVDKVANVDRYDYDANGNQIVRNKSLANQEQVLAWDADNRLSAATPTRPYGGGGGQGASCTSGPGKWCIYFPLLLNQMPAERYSYDADGGRIRKETPSQVTHYIGPHFEVTVGITNSQVLTTTTKYYAFGGQRLAVRQNGVLSYLHGDHLGSTSVTTSNSGAGTNDVRYFAYGSQRGANSILALPTDHTFTGQKLDRSTGLLYYGARYYDSALGTFISPDSLVPAPGDPQDLNRYSYVRNNPLIYRDPTGHGPECMQFAALGPVGGVAVVGCQAVQAAIAYSPQLTQLAINLSEFASSPLAQLVLQQAQMTDAAAKQAQSGGGDTAGPGGSPNDPFKDLSDQAQRGVQRLRQAANNPIQRFALGSRAQLARAEYWAGQGQLAGVEETGPGGVCYDLVLRGENTIVEVKYWTARYATDQSNLDKLARQLGTYQAQGKQIILEMFQTQTNALTQTDWLKIRGWLQGQGIVLSSQSQLLSPLQ